MRIEPKQHVAAPTKTARAPTEAAAIRPPILGCIPRMTTWRQAEQWIGETGVNQRGRRTEIELIQTVQIFYPGNADGCGERGLSMLTANQPQRCREDAEFHFSCQPNVSTQHRLKSASLMHTLVCATVSDATRITRGNYRKSDSLRHARFVDMVKTPVRPVFEPRLAQRASAHEISSGPKVAHPVRSPTIAC